MDRFATEESKAWEGPVVCPRWQRQDAKPGHLPREPVLLPTTLCFLSQCSEDLGLRAQRSPLAKD